MAAVYRLSLPMPTSTHSLTGSRCNSSGSPVVLPSYRAWSPPGSPVSCTVVNSPSSSFRVVPASLHSSRSTTSCTFSDTSPRMDSTLSSRPSFSERSPIGTGPLFQRSNTNDCINALGSRKPRVSAPAAIPRSARESGGSPANCSSSSARSGGSTAVTSRSRSSGPVNVGGRHFERVRVLGKGSFGIVWEVNEAPGKSKPAKSPDFTLALKCSMPANQKMLEACLLEAEVLQQLAMALPADVVAYNRVPQYVTHSVSPSSASSSGNSPEASADGQPPPRVLVVMSKLEGKPLDQWLYGIDENRIKTIGMAELLNGPLPGGRLATRDLASAGATTAALISQMAPVFTALAKIAYHRDISAHNFLIREAEEGREEFAVLDFGLAVRSGSWQNEYKTRNISGDPRYFSPAAWMLMVYGYKYLDAHPDPSFLEQYKYRMDHFSFGVMALEVFFALWKGPESEASRSLGAEQVHALSKARAAWRAFWTDSVGFFQMFHTKGASTTRQTLARSQAMTKYADKLKNLTQALHQATKYNQHSVVATVLEISADLVDPRGSMKWQDLTGLLRRAAGTPAITARERRHSTKETVPHSPLSGRPALSESPKAKRISRHTVSFDDFAEEPKGGGRTTPRTPPFYNSGMPARSYTFDEATQITKLQGRSWTVDEAVSLTRGVPEATIGWGSRVSSPKDGSPKRKEAREAKKFWS